ncbi:sensor histidine kinase [Clostridium paraputrificum]|uniref:sensor histidine kinase n=1 Tax=Clostridium TaxID=1485 RepID=UPI003D33D911
MKIRGIILLVTFMISMGLGLIYSKEAIILAAYTIGEYLIILKGIGYPSLGLIPATAFLIYKANNFLELLLISTLSLLLLLYITKQNHRIIFLENQWDKNRETVNSLNSRIISIEKYKDQEVQTLKLQERNDLSGKMHDKVGHILAGSLLQLEALGIVIKNDGNKKAIEMIGNISKLLRSGMEDIRVTLREIKPPSEELGVNKIRLLLEDKIKGTDIRYFLTSEGNLDVIGANQWFLITEGIRELSTNSIKYSKGKKIRMNIEVLNKIIKVEVKDDGIGSSRIKKGMGLQNLEERLIKTRGNLILDGSRGFTAIMILPVEGDKYGY